MRKSRTYKLMLSADGVSLYLACHYRLAGLVGAFIPYGQTLGVAVSVLEGLAPCDIAAELGTQRFARSCGSTPHFVGATSQLAERMAAIRARLGESTDFAAAPTVRGLYIAGLLGFEATDDSRLLKAHSQLKL